ncbi:FadR/GntR family transcriptional regulator [Sinorhizobium meliloti]|uniref:FadR/GntR family transcriptional regulator n=1 Tax=Rhizobium meliloti TaxID=382 RepID=UPI000FD86C8E|nr:FadR/GntR family transcriptional regulator [Sinorhizobium meliloti]RVE92049.1 FadR family transcriptional regulator [Sinorhizobium meliloti]RVH35221.1 FadR family transcriptional regulator [Sinorhizobium meliloti]RVH36075.1 FadR family transcriptional regulator [Sinorhizobium meliloti]
MEISVQGQQDQSTEPSGAPSRRPRVQKDVTRAIAAEICGDDYPAGSFLPRENDLCERYGVSRTVIRESLKILESKGLVRGRSRVGTVVCSKDEWNILDQQVLEWIGDRIFQFDLLNCILEARRAIEPIAAELAAARATVQEIAAIERAWQQMRDAEGDIVKFTAADVAFHESLLKASHNQVFQQLASIIQAGLKFSLQASNEAADTCGDAVEIHRQLVEALRMRDKAAARSCSYQLLDLAARDLAVAVERHSPQG